MIWNTIFTHLEMLLNTVSENIWSIRRGPWRDNLDVASTPLKIKRNLRNKQFTASLWILSGKNWFWRRISLYNSFGMSGDISWMISRRNVVRRF